MEAREITFDDVIRAGRVLFGPAFAAEAGGWRERLRATYRRRALETHPDRARSLGRSEPELAREFRAVTDAYRLLSSLRAGRGARDAAPATRRSPERPPPPRKPRSTPPEDLPRRKLRFAEFLYYSGRVRWSDLAEAIAWQRTQRPPLGRIAVDYGFLAPDDPGVILERRREAGASAVLFGEWAVRLGYLTPFQLLAALGHQLRMQRPIGQFFVERRMIVPDEIADVRERILRHNARFSA
jgi:hypothetical protein